MSFTGRHRRFVTFLIVPHPIVFSVSIVKSGSSTDAEGSETYITCCCMDWTAILSIWARPCEASCCSTNSIGRWAAGSPPLLLRLREMLADMDDHELHAQSIIEEFQAWQFYKVPNPDKSIDESIDHFRVLMTSTRKLDSIM
ncbi:hypothetical protein B0H14DRAFT_1188446 [Mycena olivaceomarginata]|nr:hypothetical protein B0H14DRAFT_1188446 [Mycena olivaceomarginata]